MKLLKSDVSHYQTLYAKYFGVELDNNNARKSLALLVRQLEITYRPVTRNQLIKLNEHDYEQQGPKRSSKKDQ